MARLNKEEVFPLIKGVLNGELNRSDFNELTNLKPGGYEYWLRKYKNAEGNNSSFVPVRQKRKKDSDGQVEVILGRGVQIKFSQLVSAQYLRELIDGK